MPIIKSFNKKNINFVRTEPKNTHEIDCFSDDEHSLSKDVQVNYTEPNTINVSVWEDPTFNIAILGCVSSGKSTLINSMFAEIYTEMSKIKGTRCPQVYKTNKHLIPNIERTKNIREEIARLNQGTAKNIEIEFEVPIFPQLIDNPAIPHNMEFRLWDIPGLNDSEHKNIYYDYVRENYYKFDLVIFNVDINSGLNTSDEIDILKLIKECNTQIKTNYERNIQVIVVCNKYDSNGAEETFEQFDKLYNQVQTLVKGVGLECPIIKYSSYYTHMYRLVSTSDETIPTNLDKQYISKIGIDILGRVIWNKNSNKELPELWKMIKEHLTASINESLQDSGFVEFKYNLNHIIKTHMQDIFYGKINYYSVDNDFLSKYNFITKLNNMFNTTFGLPILSEFLESYLKHVDSRYDIQVVNESNYKKIERLVGRLEKVKGLIYTLEDREKLNYRINKYLNLIADHQLLNLNMTDIKEGEIINILGQIIEKSQSGYNKLNTPEKIQSLIKVPIQDFNSMIDYLDRHKFNHVILTDLYIQKLISHYNKSSYSNLVKNFILNLYLKTNITYFNKIYCRLVNRESNKYDDEEFNAELIHFKNFVVYIKRYDIPKDTVLNQIFELLA